MNQPPAKRFKSSSVDDMLGITKGERIEVKWDLVNNDGHSELLWWGASVLEKTTSTHLLQDGEDAHAEETVYRIEYEAKPLHGYPDTSCASVIFASDEAIYDVESDEILEFRRVINNNNSNSSCSNDSELIENMIASVVSDTITKHSSKLDALHPNAQVAVLDKIVASKDMLANAIKDRVRTKRVLEASDIHEILSGIRSSSET
jgi:hypothetical protein